MTSNIGRPVVRVTDVISDSAEAQESDDLFEMAQMDAGHLVLRGEPSSLSDLISDTLEGFGARAQARRVTLSISGIQNTR